MTENTYFQIAVNIPQIAGVFDYHVPEHLIGQVKAGSLVIVPFGRQKVQGIAIQEVAVPQVPNTRPIEELLDQEPVLTEAQIRFAFKLAENTLSPLALCLSMMLPSGIRRQADTLYRLNISMVSDEEQLSGMEQRLIERLKQKGDLRGRQLETAFKRMDWKGASRKLIRKGWLIAQPVLPPAGVKPKMVKTVQLACAPDEAQSQMENLGKGKALERRQKILRFLMGEPWPVSVSWAYAASEGNINDLRKLESLGLVLLGENEVMRDPLEDLVLPPQHPPELTDAQNSVMECVHKGLQRVFQRETCQPYLLHGVTGSGKTEIYLRAAEKMLQKGRQVIILVPEIALTPQTIRRFLSRFPGQVGLVHSRQSPGERYDTWRRVRSGEIQVIVGPRSALFMPFKDPGLIVIDEFHDDSYYQSDIQPRYHAVREAVQYAEMTHSLLLLGSATPSVNLIFQAERENWQIIRLPRRIMAHKETIRRQYQRLGRDFPLEIKGVHDQTEMPLPDVELVDMRQEIKAGNRSIFSRSLQAELEGVLERKEQAILYLNRRGSATYIFCRDCGQSLQCPQCDKPLILHMSSKAGQPETSSLLCHTCNYKRRLPKTCPQCNSQRIKHYGLGTERVEQALLESFPDVRTLRWDASTTRGKGAHEAILSSFMNQQADILIGTQMLAKGLDLPLVTLVGVVLADLGLNLPDYRAGERTFQLLTQVAGRAGRSILGGKVILQSFQPEHYVIQAAKGHDFEGFYKKELKYRKDMRYPPHTRLVRMEIRDKAADKARIQAFAMADQLKHWIQEKDMTATDMIGPVPCFFQRVRGEYRWQIILRGPNPASLLKGVSLEPWRIEVDPPSLL
ncbi:MAG: primosomal protein N' [Anaerolineaceae bacterium]|nr:primosomal protein N' [Anaerolineaceae bacterium]